MTKQFAATLVLGAVAALANILGGWFVSYQKSLDRLLVRILIALGAGFLLAATFLVVLPESMRLNVNTPLIVLAGYLLIQLCQHTIATHFHFGEETHHELHARQYVGYTAVSGMALHAFFDGALIASGFALSGRIGVLLFVAVLLHKIPEGFTAASIMRAAGRSRRVARFSAELIAAATFLGIVSISLIAGAVRYALPFSAGVTLYVAASDLIPEVNREGQIWISGVVFLGVLFYFLTELLLDAVI
ncbi:MAG TPA: ZIP family metal transporter [Acidobacteriota bacterium]|jgi:ZIP family zinc transporter/zinc and cadmium transporter